jgi:hypothetical protein
MQNIFLNTKHLNLRFFGEEIPELEQKLHFPLLETLKIEDVSNIKVFKNICECQKLLKVTIEVCHS